MCILDLWHISIRLRELEKRLYCFGLFFTGDMWTELCANLIERTCSVFTLSRERNDILMFYTEYSPSPEHWNNISVTEIWKLINTTLDSADDIELFRFYIIMHASLLVWSTRGIYNRWLLRNRYALEKQSLLFDLTFN